MAAPTREDLAGLLAERLAELAARIERAAAAAGRSAAEIGVLAVTKAAPSEVAAALLELGQRDLGENRLEGLREKAQALARARPAPRWHFIGRIQRNKLGRLVEHARVFHSVDRLEVLDSLDRQARRAGLRLGAYLEVRVAGGDQRAGFDPAALPRAVEHAAGLEGVELLGLMAMGPVPEGRPERDRERARAAFDEVAALRATLPGEAFAGGRARLSMGMSSDLEAAVAAGSDLLRVGTALVGGLGREERA